MRYRDDWDLSSIPDEPFYAELGRRRGAKPKPKKLTPCPHCGELFGVNQMRVHIPRCPKNKGSHAYRRDHP